MVMYVGDVQVNDGVARHLSMTLTCRQGVIQARFCGTLNALAIWAAQSAALAGPSIDTKVRFFPGPASIGRGTAAVVVMAWVVGVSMSLRASRCLEPKVRLAVNSALVRA